MENEKCPAISKGNTSICIQGKDIKSQRYIKSQSIKFLENLATEAARKRYPNVPYLVLLKYRDDTANSLAKCIIDFLKLSGHQAERISNTGGVIGTRKNFIDISTNIYCKSVKISNDQQSNQKAYQHFVEDTGGLYVIATSFEQFFEWYNQNFGSHEPVNNTRKMLPAHTLVYDYKLNVYHVYPTIQFFKGQRPEGISVFWGSYQECCNKATEGLSL